MLNGDPRKAYPAARFHSFKDLTPSGVVGDARRANAQKGEKLLAVCARGPRRHAEEQQEMWALSMVENRPFGNILPHLILWIGIAIVAFPVYLAFVGSTHEPTIISNGQMPLTPGRISSKTTTARSSSARAARRASRSAPCCSTRS